MFNRRDLNCCSEFEGKVYTFVKSHTYILVFHFPMRFELHNTNFVCQKLILKPISIKSKVRTELYMFVVLQGSLLSMRTLLWSLIKHVIVCLSKSLLTKNNFF